MALIKDSIIYLIGELISKAMPFLLLPYLSRKLGVEGFGELSYFQTYLALFIIIFSLSQDGALSRYFYYYGNRGVSILILMGYVYTISIGVSFIIFLSILKLDIMIYIAICSIFQSMLSVQLSLLQCKKKAKQYTIIQFIYAFLSVFITVFFFETLNEELVKYRIISICIANFITLIIMIFLYDCYKFRCSIRKCIPYVFYILSFGIPLILHHLSGFLKGQLDRILIYHSFSKEQLGLYAMGIQLASIISIIIQAINKASLPYYYEKIKNGNINKDKVLAISRYTILFSLSIFFMLLFIPENLILYFIGDEFNGVKYYFIIFSFSFSSNLTYCILVNYLFFYGKNNVISLTSIISLFIYLSFLFLFSNIDIKYIPYSSLISSMCMVFFLYLFILLSKTDYLRK